MEKIKINITPVLLSKLNMLSSEYNIEIGGYLIGEIVHNEIYLKDILIPSQRINSVSVNINGNDQIELRKKYGDKVKEIIGHWHSHHNMGCFWSSTDTNNMKNIMSFKKFFVFVVSSNGDHLIKISQKEPFRYDFNDCEFFIKNLKIDMLRKQIDTLIVKNQEIIVGDEGSQEELVYNQNEYKVCADCNNIKKDCECVDLSYIN